jgi:hypothetical protein
MSVTSNVELDQARQKLRLLEMQARDARDRAVQGSHAAELTQRSLTQLVNQLKEEIARFEAGCSQSTAK